MAGFEVVNLAELQQRLNPVLWYAALERVAPRALVLLAADLRGRAPRGRTGKLARGFDVRARRIDRGLVQGVQAEVGARVPYGHLVAEGHRVIPRGPARSGTTRSQRASLRSGLKARRAAGAIGFVPGNPFVLQAVAERGPQVIAVLERLLMQELRL
jgi:hypothetical protein